MALWLNTRLALTVPRSRAFGAPHVMKVTVMKKWLPLLTLIVSPAACDNPTDADLDEQPAALVSVVSSSRTHTCATHAGALWCWGDGTSGQLGDGGDTIRNTPRRVQGLGEAVVAVAAGDGFTCAIERGALYCWGANDFGQLGVGTSRASATPTLVSRSPFFM